MNTNDQNLVAALENLATDIESHAGTVIGNLVQLEVGPGASGTIIGEAVIVSVGSGASGNVIGKQVSVNVSGNPAQAALEVASEIRNAATCIQSGAPVPPSWVAALLERAAKLGNAALTAVTRGAVEAAMHHYGV